MPTSLCSLLAFLMKPSDRYGELLCSLPYRASGYTLLAGAQLIKLEKSPWTNQPAQKKEVDSRKRHERRCSDQRVREEARPSPSDQDILLVNCAPGLQLFLSSLQEGRRRCSVHGVSDLG